MTTRFAKASYLRNFVFGVEDSLVSTVGLLSGIAIAGVSREAIFTTGIVLILVEAFSMAAGSFLSEASAEEYEGNLSQRIPVADGAIMFFSYIIAGLIPLLPYQFLPVDSAFKASIALALVALFILGILGAWYADYPKKKMLMRALRMLTVGGIAIVVGAVAGKITGF